MQLLTSWIKQGLAGLSGKFHALHAGYVADLQEDDGGWPGRRGGSDLYYTSFALRCLDALDYDDPEVAQRAAAYLRGVSSPGGPVESFCLLSAQELLMRGGSLTVSDISKTRKECAVSLRESHREVRSREAGTYEMFLASECFKLLGESYPNEEDASRHLLRRQRTDGGFSESDNGQLSGTNPTAAAVMFLCDRERLGAERADRAIRYMISMQSPDGGFRAHAGAPPPDLLSTFTALTALWRLDALQEVDLSHTARFLKALACPHGGFRGAREDDTADVEYTYYGLGTAGILASSVAGKRSGAGACACRGGGAAVARS